MSGIIGERVEHIREFEAKELKADLRLVENTLNNVDQGFGTADHINMEAVTSGILATVLIDGAVLTRNLQTKYGMPESKGKPNFINDLKEIKEWLERMVGEDKV